MTLNDIKSSSGYSNIVNYSQHITSLDNIGALGIYIDNGDYYKDFYIAYHNTQTCLKVKMVITPDVSGYTITSGYITLSASANEMLVTNAKVMGMIPTGADDYNEFLNDWYVAVNTDTALHDGLLDIFGQTETIPLWYSLLDDYLHVDSEYLDLVYNYLYNKYGDNGGVSNPYKYNTRTYESGQYTIPREYHDKCDIVVSGLKNNGEITESSGLTAKQTYELLNEVFSSDVPEAELIKNSDVIRIMYDAVSVGHYDIIICGHTVTNPVYVNNDGSITASVTKVVRARRSDTDTEWTYSVNAVGIGYNAIYSSSYVSGGSADIWGLDNYHQQILCSSIVDQIFFTGNMAPYTPVGTTPNSNPRTTTYPTWVDTEPLPDPNPVPPYETPTPLPIVPPDPYKRIKPIPPIGEPDPPIDDEISDDTSDDEHDLTSTDEVGAVYDLGNDNTILSKLREWLWDSLNIDKLLQIWKNNPTDGIYSLHNIYVRPKDTTSDHTITLGNVTVEYQGAPLQCKKVSKRYVDLDFGNIKIWGRYEDFRDYKSRIKLYLPFSNMVELNPYEVMYSLLYLKGVCDVITGDILYKVQVNRYNRNTDTWMYDYKTIATYTGNCKVDLPYSSNNSKSLVNGLISGIGSLLSGNISGALSSTTNMSTMNNNASMSGSIGAMGHKTPYVILEYPITSNITDRGKYFGHECNATVKVNTISGYTEFDSIHIDSIGCSDEDKQEIERICKSGIIL